MLSVLDVATLISRQNESAQRRRNASEKKRATSKHLAQRRYARHRLSAAVHFSAHTTRRRFSLKRHQQNRGTNNITARINIVLSEPTGSMKCERFLS
jgi:hypothetical protein